MDIKKKIRECFVSRKFAKKWSLPLILWTILVLASLVWNIYSVKGHTIALARDQARGFFKQIITTRLWNAQHGGVYVPITDKTKPNPYLDLPNRDITTTDGLKLTLINPAYMTRQISEVSHDKNDVVFHITSLNPIRPENRALDWETRVLEEFDRGRKEYIELVKESSRPFLRYMAPLYVKPACMKCHAKQGYKVGDIRGGISIQIPATHLISAETIHLNNLTFLHVMIYILGVAGIFGFLIHSQFAEERLEKSYQLQNVLNSLLKVSMEDIPLDEQLDRALEIILSAPFVPIMPKGSIFLVEDDPDILVMKVQKGLDPSLLKMCERVPFGRCLCGKAASRGQLRYASHIDRRHDNLYEGITPHGHYCVPIKSGEKMLGMINMYLKEGHRRNEREEEFLTAIANTLAGIIERKRTEIDVERNYHLQSVISSVLKISLEQTSLKEQLEKILDLILSVPWLTLESKGCIFLLEEDPDVLVMKVQKGLSEAVQEVCSRVSIGTCLCGRSASTRRIMFDDCIDNHHEVQCLGILPHGHYCVPIISGERLLGVINVYVKEGHKRRPVEEEFLTTIANTLAGIIERKRSDEKLQRYASELEQTNDEIKNFAYIVSHDLRAPLINLKGFSGELHYALKEIETLLRTSLSSVDKDTRKKLTTIIEEDVTEALGFIDSSVSVMDNLINAILELSRIGRRELNPEKICTKELVTSVLKSMAHQIDKVNVDISVGDLPDIYADRTSMEQIVGNILDNALKYLRPGIRGRIEITAEDGSGVTVFHFRDNGRGIAKEDIHKVFEIFRRAGRQDVPGEGMGLAYVKTLLRRHGGQIWCKSDLGVGTTFSFTIPKSLNI
jgi:signal transduction histidine kinase